MNKKILLYLSLMAVGLYVMPNTVSLFAGQHTFYSEMTISCSKCHSDVLSQLQAGGSYEEHKAAAANVNYTTYLSLGGISYANGNITDYKNTNWTWDGNAWQNSSNLSETRRVSLDTGGSAGIDGDEICMLCHNATLFGASVHTGVIVRACDDDRCHGNRNGTYNSPQFFNGTSWNVLAAGYYLSLPSVHQPFYLTASNQSSRYAAGDAAGPAFGPPGNVNGSFISKGHWACEGCHSEIAVNATISLPPPFNHSVSNPDAPKRYS